jgi:alcohol dehydrogenase (cytochrome c)
LVSGGMLFSGYVQFVDKQTTSTKFGHVTTSTHQIRTGVILALDIRSGQLMWKSTVPGPIGVGGPSIGDGMLLVPTGKVQSSKGVGGSIVAFGLE